MGAAAECRAAVGAGRLMGVVEVDVETAVGLGDLGTVVGVMATVAIL